MAEGRLAHRGRRGARDRAGPLIGALLILVTSAPFWLVNIVAGLIYAVAMPLVAITTAYVYFDRRVALELAGEQKAGCIARPRSTTRAEIRAAGG